MEREYFVFRKSGGFCRWLFGLHGCGLSMAVDFVLIQKDAHIFSFLVLLYCTSMYRFVSAKTRSKLCRFVFLYVVVLAGQRHVNTGLSFFLKKKCCQHASVHTNSIFSFLRCLNSGRSNLSGTVCTTPGYLMTTLQLQVFFQAVLQ